MSICFFASDIHGKTDRYVKLFDQIKQQLPDAIFLGGDLLPHGYSYKAGVEDFILDFLAGQLQDLRDEMKDDFPQIFLILGNDDPRVNVESIEKVEQEEHLWQHMHMKHTKFKNFDVFGYANVPPTPFRLKDWEKYDVSRYVDPGCIHPTEGFRSIEPEENIQFTTIKKDLEKLTGNSELDQSIFLFHSPPYKTYLDRAALDGQKVDHVPLDVHVGSIAIKEFIEEKKPRVSLHGHIHESTRLTGNWKEKLGETWAFNAATDSGELSLVIFDPKQPGSAERILI